jgi:hypothetical protein
MDHDHTLASFDRDGALAEASSLLNRRTALTGALGAAAGAVLLDTPAFAQKKGRKTDLAVLQLALVFEHLGAEFYDEAIDRGKLRGETLEFAKVVRKHERDHVKFVQQTIRDLGGKPNPKPKFDFGSVTRSPSRFRAVSATIEETCVEALNGAGPLVTKPVLKGASQLVSVEARHVAWIQLIRDQDPVPNAFDPAITAAQAKKRGKATGFIKSKI